MKVNKFLYEVLKKDGNNIYGWNHKCWKCHQKTMVYTYFINKQIRPYMNEHIELDSLSPVDDYLKMNYSTINKNYSKTQNIYCTSNNCSHCNALIGNHFNVDDPHDIFDDWITGDLDKYLVEKIPFENFNITEENLVGLEYYLTQIF